METRHHGTSCCPCFTTSLPYSPKHFQTDHVTWEENKVWCVAHSPSTSSMCFVFWGSSSHFKPKTPIYSTGLYRHKKDYTQSEGGMRQLWKNSCDHSFCMFVSYQGIPGIPSEGPLKSVAFRRFNQSTGEWVKVTFVINTATGVIQLPMCHDQSMEGYFSVIFPEPS